MTLSGDVSAFESLVNLTKLDSGDCSNLTGMTTPTERARSRVTGERASAKNSSGLRAAAGAAARGASCEEDAGARWPEGGDVGQRG